MDEEARHERSTAAGCRLLALTELVEGSVIDLIAEKGACQKRGHSRG